MGVLWKLDRDCRAFAPGIANRASPIAHRRPRFGAGATTGETTVATPGERSGREGKLPGWPERAQAARRLRRRRSGRSTGVADPFIEEEQAWHSNLSI
ncbi:MAG: hypothetical protein QM766_15535 [Burkholderiaceae bacterium]